MTWTEIRQAIVAAHRFHIGHVALASEITGSCQIDLEWFGLCVGCTVVVRRSGAGHFQILAAQKEEQPVARQANNIRNEYELNSTLGLQFEAFEKAAAKENANTGAGDGN